MLKRILLSVLLIFMIVTQAISVPAASGSTSASETELMQNMAMLNALGIFDEEYSEITLSYKITRADFAVKTARIFGNSVSKDASEPQSYYSDMAGLGAEAVRAVNLLTDLGLVSGAGEGKFNPDGNITYEQAVKIFVCALGYDVLAKQSGGYPTGYMAEGARIGLTDGLSLQGNEPLSWEAMINLIYNALFIDIMQTVSYGSEPDYKVVKDENLITNVMNLSIMEDVRISANSVTSIEGGDYTKPGYVKINGKLYADPSLSATENVGRIVDVYYDETASVDTVLYAELRTENTLTVSFDDIVSASGYTVTWYDEEANKDKKINLSDDAYMLYNGQLCIYQPDLIDTELNGYITFEATEGASDYDMAIVSCYSDMVVREVDYAGMIVYDAINTVTALNLENFINDERCLIMKSGEATDINGVTVGSVLAIYETPDSSYITLKVSDSKVTGAIEEVSEDEVIINGEAYTFAENLESEISGKLGKSAVFYLNADKKIIWADKDSASNLKFGYLTAISPGKGIDSTAAIRVLGEDNKWTDFNLPEKITLNGERTSGEIKDVITNTFVSGGEVIQQLIQYSVNDEGVISTINTADFNNGSITNIKEGKDFYCSLSKTSGEIRYKSGKKTFSGKVTINDSTKIFLVSPTGETDSKAYAVMSTSYFVNDNNYKIAAYNMNDGGVAGALVCYKSILSAAPSYSSSAIMVDSVTSSLDSDGNQVQKLRGLKDGSYVEYLTNGATALETDGRPLKRGDVVRVTFDVDSHICGITVDVNVDTQKTANPSYATAWTSSRWAMSGAVYSKEGNYALVSNTNPTDLAGIFENPVQDDLYAVTLSGSIMIYDSELDIIYSGTNADIMSYEAAGNDATRFFATFNYESMTNLFVFK